MLVPILFHSILVLTAERLPTTLNWSAIEISNRAHAELPVKHQFHEISDVENVAHEPQDELHDVRLFEPASLVEEINWDLNATPCVHSGGVLELPQGKYRIDPPEIHGCRKLIGRNTILELFGPLIFNGSLEFTGNLTLLGAVKDVKDKSAGKSCFSVSGSLTVSGTFLSIQDCEAAEGRCDSASTCVVVKGYIYCNTCCQHVNYVN